MNRSTRSRLMAATLCLAGSTCGLAQSPPELGPGARAPIGRPVIQPAVKPVPVSPTPVIQGFTAQSFSLTASALSPFAVGLNWEAWASASGYTVLRDGAAIAQLPATARSYQDNSLAPSSRRKYQVQAAVSQAPQKFFRTPTAAPEIPSTSVLEIETPAIRTPTGVIAKFVGPDSVEISWQAQPGAASYAIVRNGQASPIGPQPQPGFFLDTNVRPGTATYAVRTIYLRPDGQQVLSDPSPTLRLRTGPFRVLAIGDSVMWGQGLRDASKFKTKVGQWIAGQLGRSVDVTLLARSGAVLTPPSVPPGQGVPAHFAHGEIPDSRPAVRDQGLAIAPQRVPRDDVDLILVDGCINDLNVRTILDPRVGWPVVQGRSKSLCGMPMLTLLYDLVRTYPNSKIVVTGYFPIVTAYSDLRAITSLASHAGALAGSLTPAAAALVGLPVDPLTGLIAGAIAGAIASEQYKRHVIANSDMFLITSNQELTMAVASTNANFPGARVDFVPAPFGPTNAFATGPGSFLWDVPTAPIQYDEVYAERFEACRVVPPGADNVLCVEASMAHPNVRGAQAYADAITPRLTRFLPEWRARFAPVQTAQ